MSRARLALALAIVCGCVSTTRAQSLRERAEQAGILIGAAVNFHYLSEPAYTSTLAREFNMVEPEDALKWSVLRPDEQTFDFEPADRIVKFAQNHHMKVRGHTLLWGLHNPDWLTRADFTPQQLSARLHDHIQQVVGRYRGQVFAWDVVNEAFHEHGKLRDSLWYNLPGIGAGKGTRYIEQAFRWTREADPDALLFYNDAGAEEINRKSDAIYAMVKRFKRQGVPIDGVGLQMHVFHPRLNVESMAANITRFTKLGVQVHITEMDVAVPIDQEGNARFSADLEFQAEIYRKVLRACLQTSGCTAFQTWGFTDKYSWLRRATRGDRGAGLLFDSQYRHKPAYDAVLRALER